MSPDTTPNEQSIQHLTLADFERVSSPKLPPGAQGPDCIWCNGPTKRAGSCFVCVMCGETTSCG